MERLTGWIAIAGARGWQLAGVFAGFFVIWTVFQRLTLLVVTIFIALLLAALLTPVTRWIERIGLPRAAATLATLAGGAAIVAVATWFVTVQFMNELPSSTGEYRQVRQSVETWLTQGPLDVSQQQISQAVDDAIAAVQSSWMTIVNRALALVTIVAAFVTALVIAFFLIRDADRINGWILKRLVADEDRDLAVAAGRRAGDALQGYMRGVVVIGALDALFIGAALFALGIPLAGPLTALTFIGGFFPVVGATVAGLLATLVAAATQDLTTGLIVLAVVVVVQQVDGNVFQPFIMGRAVHLHPIVVLAALTAGGILAGIVGAFMAVPTAAVLTAVGNEVLERRGQEAPFAPRADDAS